MIKDKNFSQHWLTTHVFMIEIWENRIVLPDRLSEGVSCARARKSTTKKVGDPSRVVNPRAVLLF